MRHKSILAFKVIIQITPNFASPNFGLDFGILWPGLKSCFENNIGLSINHKILLQNRISM